MRTFIAVDLDKEIKSNLLSLLDKLKKKGENIKWIRQEGMHLTIKFIGEIKEEKISDIENILRKIAEGHKPFSLKINGTGFFPLERKNPRVLWAGVEADETLYSLQRQLESDLEKIGFPREKREFHPHLTLGRVKAPSVGETISELQKYKESTFGEMMVNKITFFQSILKPSGAEYIKLSEFQLK